MDWSQSFGFSPGWSLGKGLSFLLWKMRSLNWMISKAFLGLLLWLCKYLTLTKTRWNLDTELSHWEACALIVCLRQFLCFERRTLALWNNSFTYLSIWKMRKQRHWQTQGRSTVPEVSTCIFYLKGTVCPQIARRCTVWTEFFDLQNMKVGGQMIHWACLFLLLINVCQSVEFCVETSLQDRC